jgi:hypothetical protein
MKTLTVSEAKPRLGKLVDDALRAKPVFIRRGSQVVQLVAAVMPDPIPVYPTGALARSDAEIAHLSKTVTDDESEPFRR